MKSPMRGPGIVGLVGGVLGLVFSVLSTYDYMEHLDRQLHAVHCSVIPGAGVTDAADSACRTAMYSSYGAILREQWWGGIPIALFALGLYAFFLAFALSLVVGGNHVSKHASRFFGVTSLVPLLTSVVMAFIAAVKLGVFCQTCVGLYIASVVLAVSGIWAMLAQRNPPEPPPSGHPAMNVAWLAAMGLSVMTPAAIYVGSLPDYGPKLVSCGHLKESDNKNLAKLVTPHPQRKATLVTDPFCPSCKALHQRLKSEGALDNLDASVVLFPLDSECNWMLDRSLHPGSCVVSKAVLCAGPRALEVLEWIYENQDSLASLGKSGESLLRAQLRTKLGDELDKCISDKKTEVRLNNVLQFAVSNEMPVSTPQLYIEGQRICDEDTDLGLRFTLRKLAPEVLR